MHTHKHTQSAQMHQFTVVRMVRGNNKKPELTVFSPQLASPEEDTPACWIVNVLPYEQEIKWCTFPEMVTKDSQYPRCVRSSVCVGVFVSVCVCVGVWYERERDRAVICFSLTTCLVYTVCLQPSRAGGCKPTGQQHGLVQCLPGICSR